MNYLGIVRAFDSLGVTNILEVVKIVEDGVTASHNHQDRGVAPMCPFPEVIMQEKG